jgi:hypothetical protein
MRKEVESENVELVMFGSDFRPAVTTCTRVSFVYDVMGSKGSPTHAGSSSIYINSSALTIPQINV